jgi:phytoene synthase
MPQRSQDDEPSTIFASDLLEASYLECRALNRQAHSNFVYAFMLLPPLQRKAMEAIYAFMRYVDDLVDEQPASATSDVEIASKQRNAVAYCRWLLVDIYQMALCDSSFKSSIAYPNDIPQSSGVSMKISPAIIDTIERFRIPYEHFEAVLDGVEMDLSKNRYENFAELELYCERVASAVGLTCIHVWGFEGRGTPEEKTVFELARRVGIAYQLTNILRDLKEDAARDRVYLPLDEIAASGYSVEELKNGVVNSAFEKLIHGQLARAEECYRAAPELYARLNPEGKKIFGLMTASYHAILKRIAADPAAVFQKRIRPGKLERLILFANWIFRTPAELRLS